MDGQYQNELEHSLHYASKMAGRIQFYAPADPTVAGQAVPPSYKRRAIIFFPPATGRWTLSNDVSVVAGSGIQLLTSTAPVVLRLEDVGDCIQKGFYAVGITGTGNLCYIDVQMPTHCYADTPRTSGVLTPWAGHS